MASKSLHPMPTSDKILTGLLSPVWQGALAAVLILVFGLVDLMMPHTDTFMEQGFTPWAIATAMILCFIILNTITVLRIGTDSTYWGRSAMVLIGLMIFSYLLCWALSGRHIDDVGSFRWLWFVLTLVWLVFFVIVRSIKRIVNIAIRQDERLRGEE